MNFEIFGLWTLITLSAIGILFLPMWLWLVAWILKNFRTFIIELSDLMRDWGASTVSAITAIFNVIIYGEYDAPERKDKEQKE